MEKYLHSDQISDSIIIDLESATGYFDAPYINNYIEIQFCYAMNNIWCFHEAKVISATVQGSALYLSMSCHESTYSKSQLYNEIDEFLNKVEEILLKHYKKSNKHVDLYFDLTYFFYSEVPN